MPVVDIQIYLQAIYKEYSMSRIHSLICPDSNSIMAATKEC